MEIQNIVDQLNYELWEITDEICFYLTDSTAVQYIGLHIFGSNIFLWDSECDSYENESQLLNHLRHELTNIIEKFESCSKVINSYGLNRLEE